MRIRDAVLTAHRWTGLTVGFLVVFLAVTGLCMVFRPQLQPIADWQLRTVGSCQERLPLDALIEKAKSIHVGVDVEQLQIAGGGFGPIVVRFKDKQGVHMDPCTGTVLGQRHRWDGFLNYVEYLHRLLFIGNSDVSETIGGTTALTFALMVVGGLVVWWPTTRRQLKSSFKLKPGLTGQAFDLNLHRTIGAYVCIVLLWQSTSALVFTFDWARNGIRAVSGSPAPAKKPAVKAAEGPLAPSETFLRQALASAPKADDIMLIYPRKATDAVEVYLVEKDAPHANARTYLYLDPRDGHVLRFDPYDQSSAGNKVYRWLTSLHTGNIGGIVGQLLLFLGILGVPVLAFTGVRSWLRGRARVKKRSETAQVPVRSRA